MTCDDCDESSSIQDAKRLCLGDKLVLQDPRRQRRKSIRRSWSSQLAADASQGGGHT